MGEITESLIPSWCARFAACALTLALACSGRPDENFAKARTLYDKLYATELDDAYGDARMDEVVALLGKVHKRSVDAPSAQALLHAIEHGRDEFAKSRAEREKMQQAAAEVSRTQSTIDPSRVLERPDAGPPQDPFGPGASVAEINKESGACLVAGEPFRENVTNKSGTLYRLSGNPACKDKLPGLVGQVVMVSDGKVYRRVSESEVPRPANAGAADGGVSAARDGRPQSAQKPASSSDAVAAASDAGQ